MSKKQVKYLALCAVAVIALAALLCLAAVIERSVQTPSRAREVSPPENTVYRIIGEWEGKVAVYVPGTDMPEAVYDTMVMSLPEEERQHLYEGIEVESREALAVRLEDYS